MMTGYSIKLTLPRPERPGESREVLVDDKAIAFRYIRRWKLQTYEIVPGGNLSLDEVNSFVGV